ncbi:MAG: 4-amino-4-deoxy-L-arabinose-phosphoundecaprenol flippase subunit ArnF [Parcubacteria group bacterium ADurb.Bin305]|nr:hypothetical protein [Candidatus Paceibacterota bacterium]OQA43748.1 MAG: 4-amino-4-deoxy-L-arabinose-phosphoundecaprenol flippase subunit ArnF [Parcubacteria group bacterium ADurb.Bin305]
MIIFYTILYIILSVTGLVLMKSGLAQTQLEGIVALLGSLLSWSFWVSHWQFIVGIFCYCVSFLTWMFLLSKQNLSTIYPLTMGIIYTLVMIASVMVFHEQFTLYKIIGAVLIGLGILFLIK